MTRNISDVLTDHGRGNSIALNMDRYEYMRIPAMNASCLVEGLVGYDEYNPTNIRDVYEGHRKPVSQATQDGFDRGTLAHLILLQPELVAGRVAVYEGRRYGAEWEEFAAENAGKLIMRASDVRDVQAACREFRNIPEVRSMLVKCDCEVAVFGKVGGIYVKGLIDAVSKDNPCVMLDPKSTGRGIDHASVLGTCRKLHYREKMAFYKMLYEEATGRTVEEVKLIFISLPPADIGVRLVTLTPEALAWGAERMTKALAWLEASLTTGHWPTFYAESNLDVSEYESPEPELTFSEDEL